MGIYDGGSGGWPTAGLDLVNRRTWSRGAHHGLRQVQVRPGHQAKQALKNQSKVETKETKLTEDRRGRLHEKKKHVALPKPATGEDHHHVPRSRICTRAGSTILEVGDDLKDEAVIENQPKMEGTTCTCYRPMPGVAAKKKKETEKKDEEGKDE
ncbi:MAG: hypothetical protein ACLSVD_01140 [Eggerthellaceae bacterium]